MNSICLNREYYSYKFSISSHLISFHLFLFSSLIHFFSSFCICIVIAWQKHNNNRQAHRSGEWDRMKWWLNENNSSFGYQCSNFDSLTRTHIYVYIFSFQNLPSSFFIRCVNITSKLHQFLFVIATYTFNMFSLYFFFHFLCKLFVVVVVFLEIVLFRWEREREFATAMRWRSVSQ